MEVGLKVCDMPELYGAVLRLNMLIKHIMSQCFCFCCIALPKTIRKGKTRQSLLVGAIQLMEPSTCTATDTVFDNQAFVQSADDVRIGILLVDCLQYDCRFFMYFF